MEDPHVMTPAERMALRSAARDLHAQVRGVFGEETIESLLLNSYAELPATATVSRWLTLCAERFTLKRLKALAHAECLPAPAWQTLRGLGIRRSLRQDR